VVEKMSLQDTITTAYWDRLLAECLMIRRILGLLPILSEVTALIRNSILRNLWCEAISGANRRLRAYALSTSKS
jgi:hypothetical protein